MPENRQKCSFVTINSNVMRNKTAKCEFSESLLRKLFVYAIFISIVTECSDAAFFLASAATSDCFPISFQVSS